MLTTVACGSLHTGRGRLGQQPPFRPESRGRTGRAGKLCRRRRKTAAPASGPRVGGRCPPSPGRGLDRSACAAPPCGPGEAPGRWCRSCMSPSVSKSKRRCSLVQPDGPGAAPRRARRTLLTKAPHDSRTGLLGWCWRAASGTGARGTCGLRAGSRSSCSVFIAWRQRLRRQRPSCSREFAQVSQGRSPLTPRFKRVGRGSAGCDPSRGLRRFPLARLEQTHPLFQVRRGDPCLAARPGQQHPRSKHEQLPPRCFLRACVPRRIPDQPKAGAQRESQEAAQPARDPLQRQRADAEYSSKVDVVQGVQSSLHCRLGHIHLVAGAAPGTPSPTPALPPHSGEVPVAWQRLGGRRLRSAGAAPPPPGQQRPQPASLAPPRGSTHQLRRGKKRWPQAARTRRDWLCPVAARPPDAPPAPAARDGRRLHLLGPPPASVAPWAATPATLSAASTPQEQCGPRCRRQRGARARTTRNCLEWKQRPTEAHVSTKRRGGAG